MLRTRRILSKRLTALSALSMAALAAPVARAQEHAAGSSQSGLGSALDSLDAAFGTYLVGPIAKVLMFDLIAWDDPQTGAKLPFIVAWLILGAIFFTFRFGFIHVRGFAHALRVIRGDFDDPDDPGEVSHFQALSSALSATVGLGNIAGVAVAVKMGGPGALFWMVVAAFFGMSSKFAECTLGQMYRHVDENGRVLGGPMRYLEAGFAELGARGPGKLLAVLFAALCVGGSFGGGNMFQANQSLEGMAHLIPWLSTPLGSVTYGIVLAALVGLVIVGGIQRIGQVASKIVPLMCGLYLVAGVFILVTHISEAAGALQLIVTRAFNPEAVGGGVIGVLAVGFQRAAFLERGRRRLRGDRSLGRRDRGARARGLGGFHRPLHRHHGRLL